MFLQIKGLSSARFLTLKSKLMVGSPPIILWGGVKVYMASASNDNTHIMPCVASTSNDNTHIMP